LGEHKELSAAGLADLAGVTEPEVARLAELGILVPRDGAAPFLETDVQKVRQGTDTRPQPDLTGPGRTHKTAADPRSCWSAAVLSWWSMVAHTLSYSNPDELRVRIIGLAKAAGWAR
jgi:hypothetical protein